MCVRVQDLLDGYDPYPEAQKKILKLSYSIPPHNPEHVSQVIWHQGESGLKIYAEGYTGPGHSGQPTTSTAASDLPPPPADPAMLPVPVAAVYQPNVGTYERNVSASTARSRLHSIIPSGFLIPISYMSC